MKKVKRLVIFDSKNNKIIIKFSFKGFSKDKINYNVFS